MVLFAPVFLVTAVAVMLDSRGPVILRHGRVGRRGRPIDVLKFRTMHTQYCVGPRYGGDAAERELSRLMEDPERAKEFRDSQKFSNDPRVTRIGSFLRKTSLDELPQLINVLRRGPDLVGPRPITPEELLRYGIHAEEFLSVRPGVTGYWQINGRSSLDYDERIRLDLAYVSGRSLRLDLRYRSRRRSASSSPGAGRRKSLRRATASSDGAPCRRRDGDGRPSGASALSPHIMSRSWARL